MWRAGLIGAIIVTRRGMADADGKPKDVDREFVCLYMLFDENASWYIEHNIQTYTSDPKGINKPNSCLSMARAISRLSVRVSSWPMPNFPSTATSTEPAP